MSDQKIYTSFLAASLLASPIVSSANQYQNNTTKTAASLVAPEKSSASFRTSNRRMQHLLSNRSKKSRQIYTNP